MGKRIQVYIIKRKITIDSSQVNESLLRLQGLVYNYTSNRISDTQRWRRGGPMDHAAVLISISVSRY